MMNGDTPEDYFDWMWWRLAYAWGYAPELVWFEKPAEKYSRIFFGLYWRYE
jgi:hypothetical protein